MIKRFSVDTIGKLYVSNFLSGLVFWYGIEKLFMQQIGLDGAGIGLTTAVYVLITLLADIPSGMIADRWSRKGVLLFSSVFLLICSVVLATSTSLTQYVVGDIFYAFFIVATSGTYQALTYDVLHEQGRAKDYSRIMGKAYALFLVGAGVGNLASGLIAEVSTLTIPFWLSIIPCLFNIALLASIREPTFHKKTQHEKFFRQLKESVAIVLRVSLLRSLVFIWCALGAVEIFKQDFSQLYMLAFTSSPVLIGFLWAVYAFAWGLGSWAAHKLHLHLNYLMIATLGLVILIAASDTAWGLLFFILQAFAGAATFNLIETKVQHVTPSTVRASILSVMSSGARLVMVPTSLLIGWLIVEYDVFFITHLLGLLSGLLLVYWFLVGRRRLVIDTS